MNEVVLCVCVCVREDQGIQCLLKVLGFVDFFLLEGYLPGYFRLSYLMVIFLSIDAIALFFCLCMFLFKKKLFLNFDRCRQFRFFLHLVLHLKWREAQLCLCEILAPDISLI